jgi:hypothetical protein
VGPRPDRRLGGRPSGRPAALIDSGEPTPSKRPPEHPASPVTLRSRGNASPRLHPTYLTLHRRHTRTGLGRSATSPHTARDPVATAAVPVRASSPWAPATTSSRLGPGRRRPGARPLHRLFRPHQAGQLMGAPPPRLRGSMEQSTQEFDRRSEPHLDRNRKRRWHPKQDQS